MVNNGGGIMHYQYVFGVDEVSNQLTPDEMIKEVDRISAMRDSIDFKQCLFCRPVIIELVRCVRNNDPRFSPIFVLKAIDCSGSDYTDEIFNFMIDYWDMFDNTPQINEIKNNSLYPRSFELSVENQLKLVEFQISLGHVVGIPLSFEAQRVAAPHITYQSFDDLAKYYGPTPFCVEIFRKILDNKWSIKHIAVKSIPVEIQDEFLEVMVFIKAQHPS